MTAEALRQAILQRAMQGKLVPQDSSDEPAAVLLEKIKKEQRKELGKNSVDSIIYKGDDGRFYERAGGIEKDITEDIPFEIPENWEWARMELVAEFFTGNSISESEKKAKYTNLSTGRNYIGTKDVGYDHSINYDNGVCIPYEAENFRIAPQGSVLLCIEGGSAGRKIAVTNEEVCFGNKLCCFISHGIDNRFLYYYLQSPAFKAQFKNKTSGIIGGVSMTSLKTMLVSLPPFAEQQRIVEALDKIYPLLDEYEKLEEKSSKLDGEICDRLRASILQYAMQGKLVPQDSSDEPVSVLLDKIRKEQKDKIGKKYVGSCIFKNVDGEFIEKTGREEANITDEVPFDIPSTWSYVRLGDLVEIIGGVSYDKMDVGKGNVRILRGGNIQNENIIIKDDDVFLPQKYYDEKKELCEGDILIVASTGSYTVIGKPGYVKSDMTNTFPGAFLRIIRGNKLVVPYLRIVFSSEYYRNHIRHKVNGTSINNIKADYIASLLVPLPPLTEQQRIVGAVYKAFTQVDALEAAIKNSDLA